MLIHKFAPAGKGMSNSQCEFPGARDSDFVTEWHWTNPCLLVHVASRITVLWYPWQMKLLVWSIFKNRTRIRKTILSTLTSIGMLSGMHHSLFVHLSQSDFVLSWYIATVIKHERMIPVHKATKLNNWCWYKGDDTHCLSPPPITLWEHLFTSSMDSLHVDCTLENIHRLAHSSKAFAQATHGPAHLKVRSEPETWESRPWIWKSKLICWMAWTFSLTKLEWIKWKRRT